MCNVSETFQALTSVEAAFMMTCRVQMPQKSSSLSSYQVQITDFDAAAPGGEDERRHGLW